MKPALVFAVVLLMAESSMAARFGVIGHFNNVSSADGGEHCGGYSLDLWDANGRVLGLLHHHAGLCGDPPCAVIEAAGLDRATGRLRFTSTIGPEKLVFSGSLGRRHVAGKLNGRAVRLQREAREVLPFEPDTSLPAWCSFWQGVPRCTGVKELCAELR